MISSIMKWAKLSTKKTKTEGIFTLAAYSYGNMRTSGIVTTDDVEQFRLTFAESLVSLQQMIHEFNEWNLGTRIKVTFEIIPK